MNAILAGRDIVAVDNVCARLMGINPDDIEHITLAERVGLGTNDPLKITVLGAGITDTKKRFRKNPLVEEQRFGQSNRNWLVNGTFSTAGISNPIDYEFIANESALAPAPSQNGWSAGTYFINDRLNLKDYFDALQVNTSNVCAYTFAYFVSPQDQEAELWNGSDESLKIWLNGAVVYKFSGTRVFGASTKVSEIKRIQIKRGLNRLLVKTIQQVNSSYFDFTLNICDVEANTNFAGSRVTGLKFITDPAASDANSAAENIHKSFALHQNYPNPFNPSTRIRFSLSNASPVLLQVFTPNGELVATLLDKSLPAGEYEREFTAGQLPSGVYIYRLTAGASVLTKKMLLLK
jgi:hypothetical protein